jgi:hypothetical protein
MAKRAAATSTIDPPDAGANGAAAPSASDADEADAILAETQAANPRPPKSSIHRVDRESGTQQWLAEVATNVLSAEYIARRFGGGKYYVRHRKIEPGGGYKYSGSDTYDIDPSVKPDPPAAPPSSAGVEAIAVPPGGNIADTILNAGVLQMLQQMNAQNQLTLAMVERMRKGDDSPRASIPDMITAAATLVGALAPLFQNRKDPAELALKLAEAMKPAATPAPASSDVLTAFEKGMAVVSRLRDRDASSAGGDSYVPVIVEGIKTLGTALGGIASERATAAANARLEPRPPAPLAIAAPSPPPSHTPNGEDPTTVLPPNARPWLVAARPHLPMLLSLSRVMGADAAAATINRNLTDDQFFDLVEDIRDETPPGFGGRLLALYPAAATISAEWFTELLQHLLSSVDESDAGESTNGAAGQAPAAAERP